MENARKNLDRTLALLDTMDIPIHQLARGFGPLKCEFGDVFRVNQQGKGAGLAQLRLYFRVDKQERELYLLCLGIKRSQPKDIQYCKKEIKKIEVKIRSNDD